MKNDTLGAIMVIAMVILVAAMILVAATIPAFLVGVGVAMIWGWTYFWPTVLIGTGAFWVLGIRIKGKLNG